MHLRHWYAFLENWVYNGKEQDGKSFTLQLHSDKFYLLQMLNHYQLNQYVIYFYYHGVH